MPVVTISRQFGAGAITLAEAVADRLGYELVDRELVAKIAEMAKVSVHWVEAMEREAGGVFSKIGNIISRNIVDRYRNKIGPEFDRGQYLDFLKKLVYSLAEEGDVVIVGRGGQFILPDDAETLKILLIADMKDRVRFMIDYHGMNHREAEELICKEDKIRKKFLKHLDPRDPDDPQCYDIVLNMSDVNLKEAEDFIVETVYKLVDKYAKAIW